MNPAVPPQGSKQARLLERYYEEQEKFDQYMERRKKQVDSGQSSRRPPVQQPHTGDLDELRRLRAKVKASVERTKKPAGKQDKPLGKQQVDSGQNSRRPPVQRPHTGDSDELCHQLSKLAISPAGSRTLAMPPTGGTPLARLCHQLSKLAISPAGSRTVAMPPTGGTPLARIGHQLPKRTLSATSQMNPAVPPQGSKQARLLERLSKRRLSATSGPQPAVSLPELKGARPDSREGHRAVERAQSTPGTAAHQIAFCLWNGEPPRAKADLARQWQSRLSPFQRAAIRWECWEEPEQQPLKPRAGPRCGCPAWSPPRLGSGRSMWTRPGLCSANG
ncbi:uncharacterized protein LOC128325816 isoform X1 [Hemicordylus capensis]|uniref:uncharacterized protein LOC128325816 isoform X1 n=2 Tax=Hemicordylus capensis TaxID=884348 RepID=UPI0023041316|nr:uncharacterized protein LOC128325816 isoform X1 [Hemicordylus capensis]XP_053107629.1 uncharacterized protein LOC128325816 isoform X1 [Hemicordylus capensis]XP_053107640.1 uncharacterized protein LOC128325816 isoform X1 [Hemicordylus capensis]XP_053107644.1 uncharacterized protein LOC128325816 isoform X1 [Hemicordylus capensis]